MGNILSIDQSAIIEYFSKSEQYHNYELPEYFNFDKVITFVRKSIGEKTYEECVSTDPCLLSDVNMDLLLNKDGAYGVRPLTLPNPYLYWLLVSELCGEDGWQMSLDCFKCYKVKNIESCAITVKVVSKIDLSQFERKRWEIKEGKENVYVIDTNIFVKCPDIISKIGRKYTIVIPATVLEELDKLKLKQSVDQTKLLKAAKNINLAFTNQFSKMEEPDVSLLPAGFDVNNPDCKILSVAIKYKIKGANAILLTSDVMLQSRASALGLTVLSLSDFLK